MQKFRRVFLVGVIVVLGLLGVLAYRYWYQPTYDFFNTSDASVTGSFVRVAAPASGQISDLRADVGTSVNKGDVLATIKVISNAPSAVSTGPSVPR
ncbi:MAG: biotin/lipoyl-binding protein, partial [Acidobacteriota bacterium]